MYTVINPTDVESLPGIWNAEPELSLYARECRKALWAAERNPELVYMLLMQMKNQMVTPKVGLCSLRFSMVLKLVTRDMMS